MRTMRRWYSLLLCVTLLVSLLVLPASAVSQPYIKQVEAGKWTSWAVTSDGDLYGWGECKTARLFNGSTMSNTPVKLMSGVRSVSASSVELQPTLTVKKYDDYGYVSYGATPGTVLTIIKENGDLYTWGDNTCFQLGKGYYEAEQETYEPYYVMGNVVKAATNDHSCAAVTEDGDLYFWGYNLVYGYGNNQMEHYPEPTVILTDVKDVELSEYNVVALKNDGSVWMMGSDRRGGMSWDNGDIGVLINQMTKVMDGCMDIAAGQGFAMAVKTDGTLCGWGWNNCTVLGRMYDAMAYTASPVVIDTGVKSMDAGNHNACYIKNDGSLWSIGDGQEGQRGIGWDLSFTGKDGVLYAYPTWPTEVASDVHSVSVGVNHMLYLKNDGTMFGAGGPESENGALLGRGGVRGEYYDDGQYTGHSIYCWHSVPCGLSYGSFAGQFGPIQDEVELVAGFADVPATAYYREAVEWAVDSGITSGTGDYTFSPDQTCTRAQIMTFLWRAAGSPEAEHLYGVWDVTADKYYFKAVQWAAEQDIIDHFGNFDPDAPCTRAMAVEFIWKANGAQGIAMDDSVFTDVSQDASYSIAVDWAVLYGITSGTSATTFSPNQTCTRAQIVTFLYRADQI